MTSTSANATRQRLARAGRRRFLLIMAVAAVMLAAADWFTGGVTRSWVFGTAALVVTSEPAGATVSVDGAMRGTTPVTLTVEPGPRTLLITHPHHPRHVEHLKLTRDQRLERQVTLQPAWGTLLIASNPKGARVTIDGVAQDGATPLQLDRIRAGIHEIVLRIPERTTQRITAEVLPDTRAEVAADLERARTGTLAVAVTPADATVVLVDEFGGEHRAGQPLPVGDYTLKIQRDGYRSEQRPVRVTQATHTIEVTLPRLTGRLDLNVRPEGARVTIAWGAGSSAHSGPYTAGMELPAGPVTVEASASGYRTARRTVRIGENPTALTLDLHRIEGRAGDRIQDPLAAGGLAPPMVVVPAGRLSLPDSPVRQRAVPTMTFDMPFAIGTHEVTRGDWARYAASTGRAMAAPREGETDTHPVTGVGFQDAVAYVDWLSAQTGEHYRLPSESEWEYAARAGQTGPYPNGDDPTGVCAHGNVADSTLATRFRAFEVVDCDDGQLRAGPVGQFPANAWGLHDTIGNVAEWTATCWTSAPGTADPQDADCGSRTVRGGAWDSAAAGITLSSGEPASSAGSDRGLRLLRDL